MAPRGTHFCRKARWLLATMVVALSLLVLSSWSASVTGQAEKKGESPQAAGVIDAALYPSLQAALDAIPASGGVVRLPPGIYKLERPLILARSASRLEGAGPATILVNLCPPGEPTLIIRPADLRENPKAELWRVEITGLRLQGEPSPPEAKSSNPSSGPGILAQNVNELFIHGVTIDHHGGHGIHLANCYENPRIIGCAISYNRGAGIAIDGGHDIVVANNQLEENQFALRCLDSFNLCMTGNNIDDHLGDGIVIENTYGSVVSGNMIEECQGAAIVLGRDCYGITLSANVIAHNFGGGIRLLDAWGCAVSANTFVLNGKDSVYAANESGRIVITGNSFCDSFVGGTTRRPGDQNFATGLRFEGTTDVVIGGNQFSGLDGSAVVASGQCRRILVAGNIVVDVNKRAEDAKDPVDIPHQADCIKEVNIVAAPTVGPDRR
ncbi:MAG: right-handed parallel beta-helix repeat-containing protein [Thermoguttaceae bacterium]|nr:right-handed parallel beta-helix repeat-containing protein [Thermoguttaceae bacterium]